MDTFQHQVLDFEMPTDDFDPNFVPEDGLQYLQQVVFERKRCPTVVVKPLKNTECCPQTISWQKYFDVINSYHFNILYQLKLPCTMLE